MPSITKNPLPLRVGGEIPSGSTVTWRDGIAFLQNEEKTYKVSALGAAKALGIPTPSPEELEEWVNDSLCESVLGETVEPDGIDEHGSPSWLLALRLI